MNLASPLWQIALLFFAAVFLLFETWRGWRAGVVRAWLNLAALVFSGLFGFLAGQAAGALLGGADTPAGFLVGVVVGLGVGLIAFVAIWLAGAILFKRTEHQRGLTRLFYGMGGALAGAGTALLILWGGISLIRALGAMGAGSLQAAAETGQPPPPAARGLATLRESLEMGGVGRAVQAADPIPPDLYDLLQAITRLTSSQEAMRRFLEYPDVKAVVNHPRMAALLTDPDIIEAAQNRNLAALLTSRSLRAALDDPSLAATLRQVDVRAALNYALAPPQTQTP